MKQIILITALFLMVAPPCLATNVAGTVGIGFVDFTAPIGVRYWVNERVGVEGYFGYQSNEKNFWNEDTQAYDKGTATEWAILVGVPINVLGMLEDRALFNVVPMYRLQNIGKFADGAEADKYHNIVAILEFEIFVTGWFSVSGGHGFGVEIFQPGKESATAVEQNNTTSFYTLGQDWTQLGVHFYFGGRNE